jgi:hypothetical protein
MYRPMRLSLWAGMALIGAVCVKGDIVAPALGPDDSYSPVDGRGTTASGEAAFPSRVPPDASFLFAGAIALSAWPQMCLARPVPCLQASISSMSFPCQERIIHQR